MLSRVLKDSPACDLQNTNSILIIEYTSCIKPTRHFRWLFVKKQPFSGNFVKNAAQEQAAPLCCGRHFQHVVFALHSAVRHAKKQKPTRLRGCAEISGRSRFERNPASSVSFRRLAARARSSFARSLRAMFLPAGSRSFLRTSRA